MQDPTEKHFCDVGILGKYEVNNNNNKILRSFKLIVLLGLTAPDRSADVAKDLRLRTFLPESVSLKLPGLCKTLKLGDSPKISFHAAFAEDTRLCRLNMLPKIYRPKEKRQADPLPLIFDLSSHHRI